VVISPDGSIAAERAHAGPGEPHAEAAALDAAGDAARGGTVIVTLEPCNHHGRTPPCTDAIIAAGIRRVVIGIADPDPRVDGAGVRRLRTAGIEVISDVAPEPVMAADPGYYHHRRTGRPRVVVKLAATLDGLTAAADGTSQWITGTAARHDGHLLRSRADAVMVGAGTLIEDDPLLTVRVDGYTGPQPRPIVVAGKRPLPARRRLYARSPLVYTTAPRSASPDVELVEVPGSSGVDLGAVLKDLGSRGVLELLVEGGSTLVGGLAAADLIDHYVIYLAGRFGMGAGRPMFDGVFATLSDAIDLDISDVVRVDEDVRVDATPRGRLT
jgi:diaminohydroxyphosphoribosylaminopyrimidine deaminase/5-amino-6-(5-phosphoribosylamino)uracil reductase